MFVVHAHTIVLRFSCRQPAANGPAWDAHNVWCGQIAKDAKSKEITAVQAACQMIDVHIPPTDGRELRLTRNIEPELTLLLERLKLELPDQPPLKSPPAQAATLRPM